MRKILVIYSKVSINNIVSNIGNLGALLDYTDVSHVQHGSSFNTSVRDSLRAVYDEKASCNDLVAGEFENIFGNKFQNLINYKIVNLYCKVMLFIFTVSVLPLLLSTVNQNKTLCNK